MVFGIEKVLGPCCPVLNYIYNERFDGQRAALCTCYLCLLLFLWTRKLGQMTPVRMAIEGMPSTGSLDRPQVANLPLGTLPSRLDWLPP